VVNDIQVLIALENTPMDWMILMCMNSRHLNWAWKYYLKS